MSQHPVIAAIVAIDNKGVIGKEGGVPWYLPADLAHFKNTTMGHPIVMGRKTHESIGKALPGRQNIVITHDKNYQAEGCEVVGSLEEALATAKDKEEVFIIGGESIYDLAMPQINRVYLTKIKADIPGDKFFKYNPAQWRQTSSKRQTKDEVNRYDYEFATLERI